MKIKILLVLLALALTAAAVAPAASAAAATATPTPAAPAGQLGPNQDDFPTGVNPLTGLPVTDPASLTRPAVLVSLSNFPPSVRPQTGLSFAPQVYEIYITEGMTRFLTVFYGDLPQSPAAPAPSATPGPTPKPGAPTPTPQTPPASPVVPIENQTWGIEGVRSGREAYVPIINAFPNGCLVAASKSSAVNVSICRNVYGSNPTDINSAGLTFDQLAALAEANKNPKKPVNYSGNAFSAAPPAGGQPASQLNVFYSWLNQAQWKYDPAARTYLRYEDYGTPEKAGQFRQSTDRLTGDPVHFENVVILLVEHIARRPTIIDLNMGVGTQGRAVVLRDGQIYTSVKWTMVNESYERTTGLARPIRLRNADGSPFELAPGHTWFHVATTTSAVWQLDAKNAVWKYRYYPPTGAQ